METAPAWPVDTLTPEAAPGSFEDIALEFWKFVVGSWESGVGNSQRKIPRIFFPMPENTPSIARRTRCFTVPS
jgi:hypothetical protein